MKVLSPRVHGYLDYVAVLVLALAPSLFGFGGIAAAICYVAAILHLAMSLSTAYPLSLAKLVPFRIHGYVEFAASIAFVVMPWIVGFDEVAASRNFYLAFGIVLFGLYMITNYRAAELPGERGIPSQGAGIRP